MLIKVRDKLAEFELALDDDGVGDKDKEKSSW